MLSCILATKPGDIVVVYINYDGLQNYKVVRKKFFSARNTNSGFLPAGEYPVVRRLGGHREVNLQPSCVRKIIKTNHPDYTNIIRRDDYDYANALEDYAYNH